MTIIPVFRKLRQEELAFEASLEYILRMYFNEPMGLPTASQFLSESRAVSN